jgi:magnesium transporter
MQVCKERWLSALLPDAGLLSMNITVPTNKHEPTGSFTIFGIVVALAFLDICALLLLVRRWWMQAKKKSTVAH